MMISRLGTNAVLSHLACVYGLHRMLTAQNTPSQHAIASVFEAWVYAAKEDVTRRGFAARGLYEAQMDAIFDLRNWKRTRGDGEMMMSTHTSGTLRYLHDTEKPPPKISVTRKALEEVYMGGSDLPRTSVVNCHNQTEAFVGHRPHPYIHPSYKPALVMEVARESSLSTRLGKRLERLRSSRLRKVPFLLYDHMPSQISKNENKRTTTAEAIGARRDIKTSHVEAAERQPAPSFGEVNKAVLRTFEDQTRKVVVKLSQAQRLKMLMGMRRDGSAQR